MYTNAEKLIDAGLKGKWVQLSAMEQEAVIDSIAACNLVRGSKGIANALRHYTDRGYFAITDFSEYVEDHPLDLAEKKRKLVADARAVLEAELGEPSVTATKI
jgi:hypothetical protein